MHEKLGCLGTLAGLGAVIGLWMAWEGGLDTRAAGVAILMVSSLFLYIRIRSAQHRRQPPSD